MKNLGTQYTGELNFFLPDFNKLLYSLRSQGVKKVLNNKLIGGVTYLMQRVGLKIIFPFLGNYFVLAKKPYSIFVLLVCQGV